MQNVGKEKVNTICHDIAKFLELPDVEQYTGQTFKLTANSLAATNSSDALLPSKKIKLEVIKGNLKSVCIVNHFRYVYYIYVIMYKCIGGTLHFECCFLIVFLVNLSVEFISNISSI